MSDELAKYADVTRRLASLEQEVAQASEALKPALAALQTEWREALNALNKTLIETVTP